LGGALEARQIEAGDGYLVSEVVGEIEKEEKVLVVKRIHVTYHLRTAAENRETAERVHGIHAQFCPVYRTISGSVDITTSLELETL